MYSREPINLTTPIERFRYSVTDETFNDIQRARIHTLGDLVSMSISDIVNNKMNRYGKLEIVEFVHSLGYKFRDETVSLVTKDGKTILVSLDTPLEQLSSLLSTRTFNGFKRARIKTLGDLVSKSESDLLQIQHFGDTSLRETIRFVHLFGYELLSKKTVIEKTNIENQISKREQENEEISKRIESKRELLSRYEELMKEKSSLLEQEKVLDYKINQIIQELTELVGVKDGQKVK